MTKTQINTVKRYYNDMFGDGLDRETLGMLEETVSIDDLYELEEEISAGTFDCALAVLEGR